MQGPIRVFGIAAMASSFLLTIAAAQVSSEFNISTGERSVHIMQTPAKSAERQAAAAPLPANPTPALNYNGGPVMTSVTTYAIFWVPPTLQTGVATGMSASYEPVQTSFLSLYPGHGIANNNTQYYMTQRVGFFNFTDFILNSGSFGGSYVDTSAYPASGCSSWETPGACLSDAQIQTEIQKVMSLKGWTGGLNKMFFLYTSSGEGSCAGFGCAYSSYCAYHSYFYSGSTPVIYGNEPYADSRCQLWSASSPNGDPAADAAASITSHELTEAITDPLLNAWYSTSGEEIGDLCAWNYGTNTWDGGKANQSWFEFIGPFIIGHGPIGFFELQQEYDNHVAGCVQLGP
jgi:hypothetical protein